MLDNVIDDIKARLATLHLTEILLHEVVTRTDMQREGYFTLRKMNDLAYSFHNLDGATPEDYLQHLDNLIATLDSEIERIEQMA